MNGQAECVVNQHIFVKQLLEVFRAVQVGTVAELGEAVEQGVVSQVTGQRLSGGDHVSKEVFWHAFKIRAGL
ncbi:hypothetical protein GCM10008955_41480 [Deinococcus malanensis]|uniref:Uncharacterized protein n=1 Tax=Deinococcus malanensis TaxID=1706855 RepID=A0ABQ2F2P0_9DEIO|nr:hypothetical protein GCM10008955_41480 [Deinococcus malanensis]